MNSKKILTEICYPEDLPEEIRSGLELSEDRLFKKNGRIYLVLGNMVFCCDDDYDGNELVRNMLHSRQQEEALPRDKAGLYRRMMLDSCFQPDPGLIRKLYFRVQPSLYLGCILLAIYHEVWHTITCG